MCTDPRLGVCGGGDAARAGDGGGRRRRRASPARQTEGIILGNFLITLATVKIIFGNEA